jgi:DNA-binding XRE family transcriptional regulator
MSTIFEKDFLIPDTPFTPKRGRWRQPRERKIPSVSPAHDELWHQEMLNGLKSARFSRHLTQKQLAELLGSTQSWVSSFENGRINPSIGFLLKYSALLGKKLKITAN